MRRTRRTPALGVVALGAVGACEAARTGIPARTPRPGLRRSRGSGAPAPPPRAQVPAGYGGTGFQSTGLTFPTVDFVVRATKRRPA
jgi:hypothetical protein